jgi:putative transposase
VKQNYQTIDAAVTALAVPEVVSVALGEVVADVREGLLAMAVGTGLQIMAAMMDADVTAGCGPKGKHDLARTAVRHGREQGSAILGGRRVPVERPRMRASDGSGELPIPSYELFTSTEVLGRMALQKMLAGISTRRYPVGLEPMGGRWSGRRRPRASPRSRGGSSKPPRPHWPTCSPGRWASWTWSR